jgi:hypothetical protein
MAKKASTNSSAPVTEMNKQKMRKKQAKREAKMMLEIEETKVSIEKAEKKLAKAQARLEARNTHLRTLEADLSEFRTSHEETEVNAPDAGFDHQTGQPEPEEATEANAQQSDTERQTAQTASEDEEATIILDAGFDHQTGQPELEEITSSNQ